VNYYPKKIFIGSSSENKDAVEEIAVILKGLGCSPIRWWTPEVFTGGQYTFESILKVAHKADAGLFLLAEDDVIHSRDKTVTATRANVVLEAGVFYGVLGRNSVGLCTIGSPDIPSDWNGITRIPFNQEDPSTFRRGLKRWLENVVYVNHKEPPNVHMSSRKNIHTLYPVDVRLGFNKNERGVIDEDVSKHITHLRMLCLTGNQFINPDEMSENRMEIHESISISEAIRSILDKTGAQLDLILAKPTKSELEDVEHKISNSRGGAEKTSYSAQSRLYKLLTSDKTFIKALHEGRFCYCVVDMCIPFAIFAVEYKSEYAFLNHVKIDPYSLHMTDENEMRTMIIWQNSDKENYEYFLRNFNEIRKTLKPLKPADLKDWSDKWENEGHNLR
jgi:hypothetical protein